MNTVADFPTNRSVVTLAHNRRTRKRARVGVLLDGEARVEGGLSLDSGKGSEPVGMSL